MQLSTQSRALTGSVAVLVLAALTVPDLRHEAWTRALLAFAAAVLVPLVLDLLVERNDAREAARLLGWVRTAQLPAALLLVWACGLPAGWGAALLTLPWVATAAGLAALGILRALRHGWARPLGRLCGDVGLVYLAGGALWALADRAGLQPLRFPPAIVGLTAVHFHYAGLLLPLVAGLLLRRQPESRGAARLAVGAVLGVPAVAVGITLAQVGFGPAIEAAAGVGLALAGLGLAVLQVRFALDAALAPRARVLLAVAGGSLFFAMLLAGLYAARSLALPFPWLDLPQMRLLHGTANALGFGLCGLLGWRAAEGREEG